MQERSGINFTVYFKKDMLKRLYDVADRERASVGAIVRGAVDYVIENPEVMAEIDPTSYMTKTKRSKLVREDTTTVATESQM
jgi:uncharacterized protein YaiE (UPF0345 family)